MANAATSSRRIVTATNFTIGGPGSGVSLWGVVVDTGAAGSLTLKQGSTTGAVISIINTAATVSLNFHGMNCNDGLYVENSATGGCVILYE